ncbi:MAG: methylated-DNA--[protein]-cysteine S-methyltransferase [Gammaproteobacteria bacterium]|nr:methylated-DNA--[protein]-cysteine S-methyltransferase [Gammaproteobacteria bacterium]
MRRGKRVKDFDAVIAAPFGRVGFILDSDAITDISFLDKKAPLSPPRSAQARKVSRVLRSYFSNPSASFHLPLKLSGTPFQQRVWRALRRIPAGRTLSYGVLARKLDTSARAVGNACRANPVPIIVPCHRVVASNGLGGFMGKRSGLSLSRKHWLLEHERGK